MEITSILAGALVFTVETSSQSDPAQAASVSVINGAHDVVNGNNPGNLGLVGLGHTVTLFSDTSDGYVLALLANDILVIEQNAEDAASVAALLGFMDAGGRVIELGGSGASLMNALFGASATQRSAATITDTFDKTGAAAGTSFADDPTPLIGLNSQHEITSGTPAGSTVFYSGTTGDAVLRLTQGAGD